MTEQSEHLSNAQVENYGKRTSDAGAESAARDEHQRVDDLRFDDQRVEAHLADCPSCRNRLLDFHRTNFGLLAEPQQLADSQVNTASTPECPSDDALRELAAGLSSDATAAKLTQHAATCNHCGPLLRTFTEDFSDDFTPEEQVALANLQSSSAAWQKNTARQMLEAGAASAAAVSASKSDKKLSAERPASSAPSRKPFFWKWILVPATAAVVALATFTIWYTQRDTPEKVERLLAQAYTEQRTMEMRWLGAKWGPMNLTRGATDSRFSQSPNLLDAESSIGRRLRTEPSNSQWLRTRAKADILERNPGPAISTLNQVLATDSESVPTILDLSMAYSLQAEMSGDPQDNGRALELLSKVLKSQQNNNVALFNRALVYERLHLNTEASNDWKKVLQLEMDPGWKEEVERHLRRLEEKKNSPEIDLPAIKDADNLVDDSPVAKIDSETYVELLLTKVVLSSHPLSSHTKDTLELIARKIAASHHDDWLSSFLRSPYSAQANYFLRIAIDANREGNPKHAQDAADTAKVLFSRSMNGAGVARSEFEAIYALHRRGLSKECESRAELQSGILQRVSYSWLRIQVSIERSICAAMASHFDRAATSIGMALNESRVCRYGALELRAMGILASFDTAEGRLRESWLINSRGLEQFWKGHYPAERAFQFYSDLEVVAEKCGMWNLALALQREAIAMLDETDRQDFKAMAHLHLAGVYEISGEIDAAQQEFNYSYRLFEQLPQTSATRLYLSVPQIELAELEANRGLIDLARMRLEHFHVIASASENFLVKLAYERAQAAVERNAGRLRLEQEYLRHTVSIGNQGFQALSSPTQRWEWRQEVGTSYRRLLEIEISDSTDPWQHVADWESYRLRESIGRTPFGSSITKNMLARNAAQSRALELSKSSFLAFSAFPDRLIAWIVDDRGATETVIPIAPGQLEGLISNFRFDCNDPSISLTKVNADGLRLYQLLFGPLARNLDPARTLFIEADEALSSIPWPALLTPSGQYLGREFSIANATGLFSPGRFPHRRSFLTTMLIAEPGGVKIGNLSYPALPEAALESDLIAQLHPNQNRLLRGRASTRDALLMALPNVSSFHFAGHAISHPYGGELLLHSDDGDVALSSFELEALDLSRLQLAVLSACSTGAGEDPGRDPYGLVHSFLWAGTQRVVASAWNVDSSSTQQFMRYFYSSVAKGADVTSAAKTAREHLAANPSWKHPYYWAAFQVFGAPN